jgi:hypothetical protein
MAISPAQHPSDRDSDRQRSHETDLVEGAIALVATGGARRASFVLLHGGAILPQARASAHQRGVHVRAAPRADGGCDIIVEPIA